MKQHTPLERWLTLLALLFTLPFLAAIPLMTLLNLIAKFHPEAPLYLILVLDMPLFFIDLFLSDPTRYLAITLAALLPALAAWVWLIARERGQVWRRGRFYLLTLFLAAILAFPLLMRYQPPVKAAPGVEMHIVEEPGLLAGAIKSCQAAAEIPGCQYEPLGWADAQTLVYRKWCDGHYTRATWQPGSPGVPLLYDLATGRVGGSLLDSTPSRETCAPSACVLPALAERKPFEQGYYPGEYGDALVSPDGRWVAFTVRYIYGPEDLLVVSSD
jgi:hypothetical protein